MKNNEKFRIGAVSKESGLSVHTIRYYEKLGLLKEGHRTHGGYREYSAQVFQKLTLIKRTQKLGLTLSEIKALLQKRESSGRKEWADYVGRMLRNKIRELEANIGEHEKRKKDIQQFLKILAKDPARSGLNS